MATQSQPTPKPANQRTVQVKRVDLPELSETFADSSEIGFFDGHTLRINFGVTRVEAQQPGAEPAVLRYPACRLVLTRAAAMELVANLQKLVTPQGDPPAVVSETKQ